MSTVSDGYRTSLRAANIDSDRGSLRKIVEILARCGQPNTFTALARATNATGTTYNAFASTAGFRLVGANATGTSLTFRRVAAPSVTFIVASAALVDLPCAANASEWEVKRTDDSNTPVTLNVLVHSVV